MKTILVAALLAVSAAAYAQEWRSTYDPSTGVQRSERYGSLGREVVINDDRTGNQLHLREDSLGTMRGTDTQGNSYTIGQDGRTVIRGADGSIRTCTGEGTSRRCY